MNALIQVSQLRTQLDEQKAQIQKLQQPPVNLTVPYVAPQPFYWTNWLNYGTNTIWTTNGVINCDVNFTNAGTIR